MCQVAVYFNTLERIALQSLAFEKNMLLPHEMISTVYLWITNLEEFPTKTIDDAITSFERQCLVKDEDIVTVTALYLKVGREQQKLRNQESETEINSFTNVSDEAINSALWLCEEAVDILVTHIKEWFSSFRNEVFQSMSRLNPHLKPPTLIRVKDM